MKKYYYAIKVGNNVENIIVESWEECEEYVIGFPSIYKKFKTKREAKRYLKNISNEEVEICLLSNERQRFYRLKEKLEFNYKFPIPNYIIEEIINKTNYNNLCVLLNLAVYNKRITKQNAEMILKNEIY